MARPAETAIAEGSSRGAGETSARLGDAVSRLLRSFAEAFETEIAQRRMFLWLPVAAGAGVVCYMAADREPSLWLLAPLTAIFAVLAFLARERRGPFLLLCGISALFAGELSAAWRSARVAAPIIDRTTIGVVEGYIEELDFRRAGARFVLRVHTIEGMAPGATPFRVRLSTRRAPPFEAGTYVKLKARLLPPSHASLPGGYDSPRTPGSLALARSAMRSGESRSLRRPPRPAFILRR